MAEQQAQQAQDDELDLAQALALLAEKDEQIALLLHRVHQLERMHFGPRSSKRGEHVDPSQLLPFPHLQELLQSVAERAAEREEREAAAGSGSAGSKPKGKARRRSLDQDVPADLPRRRREKKLSGDECGCGCGGVFREFSEEVSRRLDKLQLFFIDERVTTYYACDACERVISVAPESDSIIEGGILGPDLIADLVYQRFGNHVPYHRLEQELAQLGVPVSRTVLGRSVLRCGELLEPIVAEIQRETLASFLVQIDDTPVVVRNGKGKGRRTGRIWVYRSPDGNVVFDFQMDRSQAGPKAMLGAYCGFIQADAYAGHDFLFRDNIDRTELGCWSHVVRKFDDARDTDRKLAAEFDVLASLLFRIETEARALSPPERLLFRSKHTRPVLDEIKDWLDARRLVVTPKSTMGKAISYALDNWTALTNFLLDGRIADITNNGAERALRRVAIGRKNWMHIGAEEAGQPAAILMSILQTCREHGVNAVEYLRDVLRRVVQPGSAAEVAELTPARWKANQAARERVAAGRAAIRVAVQSLVYSA